MYGWYLAASLSILLTFNLFFIFEHVYKLVKKLFLKFYNYVNYLYKNKKFNFQSDHNVKIDKKNLK